MKRYPIDIAPSGAILLGTEITCDGFHRDFMFRVQTHIHTDHMGDFNTSKGFQDIFMTESTQELLIAEYNAELPNRQNIHILRAGVSKKVGKNVVTVLESGHMLGAVQVAVRLADGLTLGYSGDFQWPLNNMIQVEALVLDATYGGQHCIRKYSQEEAETRFLELVLASLKLGPVHIKSHRGTLQRGLQVLAGNVQFPILGSPRFCAEVDVYRRCGYVIDPILPTNSKEGMKVLKTPRFIRFYGVGDGLPVDIGSGRAFTLSAFMAKPDDPVIKYSERAFGVALSNHADFLGTLEYVKSTNAKFVLTDNSRGGHAVELAQEIKSRLGIEALPSIIKVTREWGL